MGKVQYLVFVILLNQSSIFMKYQVTTQKHSLQTPQAHL